MGKAGGENSVEVAGVDGRIILRRMFREGKGVECSGLMWLRIGRVCQIFGMGVMKFWVLKNVGNFLTS